MDTDAARLLDEILRGSSTGVDAVRFRAKHHEHLSLLDKLEHDGFIRRHDGNVYQVQLFALSSLATTSDAARKLLFLAEQVFPILREVYLASPGTAIPLEELAKQADLPRSDITRVISYMREGSILGGWTDLSAPLATVTPGENILRYGTFQKVLDQLLEWRNAPRPTSSMLAKLVRNDTSERQAEGLPEIESFLHPAIINSSLGQLRDGHLRDAVLNAVLALGDMLRAKTGLTTDGDRLIGEAFSLDKPLLIVTELETEHGCNEQKGTMQMLKGLFQGVRNPKAHTLQHRLTEKTATQYLMFASLLADQIDEAQVTQRKPTSEGA